MSKITVKMDIPAVSREHAHTRISISLAESGIPTTTTTPEEDAEDPMKEPPTDKDAATKKKARGIAKARRI